jgi:hypothetical protein
MEGVAPHYSPIAIDEFVCIATEAELFASRELDSCAMQRPIACTARQLLPTKRAPDAALGGGCAAQRSTACCSNCACHRKELVRHQFRSGFRVRKANG